MIRDHYLIHQGAQVAQWVRRARMAQWVRSLDLTIHTSLSPIRRGFAPGFVNYKKGCTRLAAASDQVYQFLAHGRWFSSGTPASSTTKTGRHNIAEILLKVVLNTKNQIKSILIHQIICCRDYCGFHYLPLWWSYHIIKDRTRANVIDEWRMQCFDSRWFYIFSFRTVRSYELLSLLYVLPSSYVYF